MIEKIAIVLNILFGLYGVYFTGVVVLGALKKYRPYPHAPAQKRIAAIIAARNEEGVIADSVSTLMRQNYPEDLFDVWVVPNNCTDDTARVAQEAGARILPCTVPVSCKGDVLAFTFSELLERENYDAFCIFDADNLVDPGFLAAANNALCGGARVAQGFRDSKNPDESWVAGCMSIFHWFMSRFFNRSRTALGMSAMLNGTGIVLSADLIRETGWKTFSLTEDLEFTAQCGLRGEKIAWLEDAVIYDEQPNSFAVSFEQRRRWFAGTLQCLRRYDLRLWKRFFATRSLQAFDFAFFFFGGITQFVCLVPGALSCILTMLRTLRKGGLGLLIFEAGGTILGLCALCSLGALIMCLLIRKTTLRMWPAILTFSIFLVSWLPANLFAVLRPTTWTPIAHTSKAKLPDVARAEAKEKSSSKAEAIRRY